MMGMDMGEGERRVAPGGALLLNRELVVGGDGYVLPISTHIVPQHQRNMVYPS